MDKSGKVTVVWVSGVCELHVQKWCGGISLKKDSITLRPKLYKRRVKESRTIGISDKVVPSLYIKNYFGRSFNSSHLPFGVPKYIHRSSTWLFGCSLWTLPLSKFLSQKYLSVCLSSSTSSDLLLVFLQRGKVKGKSRNIMNIACVWMHYSCSRKFSYLRFRAKEN